MPTFPTEARVRFLRHGLPVGVVQQHAVGFEAIRGDGQRAYARPLAAVVVDQDGGFVFQADAVKVDNHLIAAVAEGAAAVGNAGEAARRVVGKRGNLPLRAFGEAQVEGGGLLVHAAIIAAALRTGGSLRFTARRPHANRGHHLHGCTNAAAQTAKNAVSANGAKTAF